MNEVDSKDTHVERWTCDAPALGERYQVLDEEWDFSGPKPVRTIKRVRLA